MFAPWSCLRELGVYGKTLLTPSHFCNHFSRAAIKSEHDRTLLVLPHFSKLERSSNIFPMLFLTTILCVCVDSSALSYLLAFCML